MEQRAELLRFENDVKTYGTETDHSYFSSLTWFENDVKTYGTETCKPCI